LCVYHGGFFKEAFGVLARRGDVVQVAVEEEAQDALWDPGEYCLGAEDVEGE
jgi:hypothetical protein